MLEHAALNLLAKEIGSAVHRKAMTAALDRALAEARSSARTARDITRDLDTIREKQRRLVLAIEAGTLTSIEAGDRMAALRRDFDRLTAERDRATFAGGDQLAWRDALVTQALDFRSMARELAGPKLRSLIQQWVAGATFNNETRELVMEIRRVPAAALQAFDTEGEGFEPPSPFGRRFSRPVH